MNEKKYTEDGYLIVSEFDKCPLWEKSTQPCGLFCSDDCFFCKFADFRTMEFIRKVENVPKTDKWYSVCHNKQNRRNG